jgi:hypothetical protein
VKVISNISFTKPWVLIFSLVQHSACNEKYQQELSLNSKVISPRNIDQNDQIMKRMTPRAQSKVVKVLNWMFMPAALEVVDTAGLVKPVPKGLDPDAEVIEPEPDDEPD